jgi:hypothetical protein
MISVQPTKESVKHSNLVFSLSREFIVAAELSDSHFFYRSKFVQEAIHHPSRESSSHFSSDCNEGRD